jgi:hypothetical protein
MSNNIKSLCIVFTKNTAEKLDKARWVAQMNRSRFVELAVLEKLEKMEKMELEK